MVNFIFSYISPQFKKHKEKSLQEANSAVSTEQLFVTSSFQSLVKIHSAIPNTSKATDSSNQRLSRGELLRTGRVRLMVVRIGGKGMPELVPAGRP